MNIRLLAALLTVATRSLVAQERVDAAMDARIRAEGIDRSHVVQMFDTIASVIGPRLTGSSAYTRAVNYAKQKLTDFGGSNTRLESWPFGRGWELDRFSIEMVEP